MTIYQELFQHKKYFIYTIIITLVMELNYPSNHLKIKKIFLKKWIFKVYIITYYYYY